MIINKNRLNPYIVDDMNADDIDEVKQLGLQVILSKFLIRKNIVSQEELHKIVLMCVSRDPEMNVLGRILINEKWEELKRLTYDKG